MIPKRRLESHPWHPTKSQQTLERVCLDPYFSRSSSSLYLNPVFPSGICLHKEPFFCFFKIFLRQWDQCSMGSACGCGRVWGTVVRLLLFYCLDYHKGRYKLRAGVLVSRAGGESWYKTGGRLSLFYRVQKVSQELTFAKTSRKELAKIFLTSPTTQQATKEDYQ